MSQARLDDLSAFLAVADEGSFTKAAARLGTSQSALSRSLQGLEARLGVRLLNRTTRSVAPTQVGKLLLDDLRPALSTIDEALTRLGGEGPELRGTVRLSASRHGYSSILQPALPPFLARNPLVSVEVTLDDAFVDIVAQGFDAGLRLGSLVEKDMIAVRVGGPVRFAVVASPGFCLDRQVPATPRALAGERCIAFRLPRSTGIMPWAFEQDGAPLNVRVTPTLVLDDGDAILRAALDGVGYAYLFLDQVRDHLEGGRLIQALPEFCPERPGYHLYHTSRRQQTAVVTAFIRHLRQAV